MCASILIRLDSKASGALFGQSKQVTLNTAIQSDKHAPVKHCLKNVVAAE
jgi:hypothetical protein